MTLVEAKAAIMAAVEQMVLDHTNYPLAVEMDNRDPIDLALQEHPFLQVTVSWMGAEQLDLGAKPRVKQHGQLLLCAVVKSGSGAAGANALLDFAMPYFDMVNLGGVEFHACQAMLAKDLKGMWRAPALSDFYFTRIKI